MSRLKKILAIMLAASLTAMTGCGTSQTGDVTEDGQTENSEDSEEGISQDSDEGAAENSDGTTGEDSQDTADQSTQDSEDLLSGYYYAQIDVEDYGTIYVTLNADVAPISVTNFVNLANEGFYDGLTFHRIISGFMIQGGDPNGNGTGGSDKTIKGEFSENGVENNLSHTRGAISMARSQDYDSASSQFFIVHEDSTYLDGQYAVFGYVLNGMDVVDDICASVPVQDSNGTVAAEDQPVISSIKILSEKPDVTDEGLGGGEQAEGTGVDEESALADLPELMNDIYNAAPGTAGSSLKSEYAAKRLLDYSETYGDVLSKTKLTYEAVSWFSNMEKEGFDAIRSDFTEALSNVEAIATDIGADPSAPTDYAEDYDYELMYESYDTEKLNFVSGYLELAASSDAN